jgi:H+/gluconate symporter-like permease
MSTIAIIGLILSVVVLIVGAYKGLGALPLTLLASLVVILTNGINVWEGFATHYMKGYTSAYLSYFLLFASSSLYASFMNTSGCATSIGYQFIDWFGKKKVLLVCTLIISALTYGGVSLFVVVYAVAPIMFLLFKEADLPRHLTMACLITGSATYTMTCLPGTPSLTNVIPTQYLGTTLTAAPVMGIIAGLAIFTMCMLYMNYAEKKARANGEHWSNLEVAATSDASFELKDRNELPAVWKSFAPMLALMLIIIIGSRFVKNSTMLATIAMLIGALITYVLNMDKFKGKNLKDLISNGLEGGIDGIGGLAGVVAFGTVVQSSTAFGEIVKWVLSLKLNPYVQGVVSTMTVSAVTGSSSGGLKIMYSSLAENFISSGANLDVLHRLTAISADALDTLPHSPGLFLMLAVLGLNHKKAYKHVFACSTIVPLIVTALFTIFCVLFL